MILKHLILILSFFLFSNITSAQALLKFDKDTVDFGTLNEGDTVKYDFWFTNVGNANLSIKQAWPSCGCTHPTYTQGDIKPGERGVLKVEFHSAGFGGQTVHKNIIIINNGQEQYANFTATITLPGGAPAPKPAVNNHDHDHPHPHLEEVKPSVETKTSSSKKKKRKK